MQPTPGVQQPGMMGEGGRSKQQSGLGLPGMTAGWGLSMQPPTPGVPQPGMMGGQGRSIQQPTPGVPGRGRSRQGPTPGAQQLDMIAGDAMQQPTPGVQHPGMIAGLGGASVDAALPGYMQASTPPMGQPSKPPTTRLGSNGDFTEQISPFGPICTPAPIEPIYPPKPIGPTCPPAKTDPDPAMSQAPFLINILNSESGNRLMGKAYSNQGPNCPGRLKCSKCGPDCFGGPIRQNFGTHGVSVQALKSLQQLKVSKFLKI